MEVYLLGPYLDKSRTFTPARGPILSPPVKDVASIPSEVEPGQGNERAVWLLSPKAWRFLLTLTFINDIKVANICRVIHERRHMF
jgi:hypothetical protein